MTPSVQTISEAEIPHPAALKMSDSMRRTESKAEYGIARRTAADFLRKVKTCRSAQAAAQQKVQESRHADHLSYRGKQYGSFYRITAPAPAPPVGANVAPQKDDKRRFVL
ncbi:hypothetical protein PSTG_14299 [Puccinia striiformis f. sp. tritici PST-78]|uniref:Uncharacterized protein n=1 Tax=Puccinia striiformis f. sp. tritici PST-78 TaxID=1165861 RepID=A0A0L0UZD1_9BASI|nr:hypothetical protein PSTG_14299 [Puccinia striiformis f. sp. tritici PST-78]